MVTVMLESDKRNIKTKIKLIKIYIPIIVSVLALGISGATFCKNYLSKFQPVCTVGDLRLRIYPISNGNENWFIPSIDIPINIANDGSRPGKVLGMRLRANYPDVPIQNNYEYFYPKWELDTRKFNQIAKERFEWINEATLGYWVPFIVLSKTSSFKHVVFESRWDKPIIASKIIFTLEIYTDSHKAWKEIGRWDAYIRAIDWSELTSRGTSNSFHAINSIELERPIYPPDLYRFLEAKEPIPEGGYNAEPSFLDYPQH